MDWQVLRRRTASEAAFALPSAMIVLFVMVVLTGAAIAVATQSSSSTARDDNVKAELEAAEAGLQVATYRLGQLEPSESQCINRSEALLAKTPAEQEGKCKDAAESLGNGASFQYWTSLPLKAGEKCAGRVVVAITGTAQRCVTSEGAVDGVEPNVRLETLVSGTPGKALFPVKGFIGLTEVVVSGSVSVPGVVASNGKIIGEGSANFERGFELCPPNGTFQPAAGAERKHSGVKIAGKEEDPPLEKTRKAGPPECLMEAQVTSTHATEARNDDSRIGTADKLEGTYAWSEKTYTLALESNAKLTLEGSKYYFCNFKASRNSRLKIPATVTKVVEIFIDSPEDPASRCGKETGKFEGEGEFIVENETKNPSLLLIQMYGKGPFVYSGGSRKAGSQLEAAIFAPNGEVEINGGQKFKGGIVADKLHLRNGAEIYEWSEELGALTDGGGGAYGRRNWEQCTQGSGPSSPC
jgi:Tfp pilus assembly protein PilX